MHHNAGVDEMITGQASRVNPTLGQGMGPSGALAFTTVLAAQCGLSEYATRALWRQVGFNWAQYAAA